MIQAFQKFSQSRPAKIFLALVALSFVAFFGGNNWFRSRHPHEVIAEVGSITIAHQHFAQMLNQRIQYLATQTKASQDDLLKAGLPQLVLNQLVQENLLNLEAGHLGLTVSDEALRNHIHSLRVFHNAKGEFDRTLFAQALRNKALSEDAFISELRQELIREQLVGAVVAGVSLPENMIEKLFHASYQARQASMLLISPQDLPVPPLPPENELEAFYKEHQKEFALPELRSLSALIIDPLAFANEISVADQDIQALFEAKGTELGGKSLTEARSSLIAELQKEKASEHIHQLTQDLDDKIAGGATLEEVAASAKGITLLKFDLLDAKGLNPLGKTMPALPSDKDLLQDVLQTGFGLEENTDSTFSQTQNGTYYMVRVEKISPPALPAFKENKERAQKMWGKIEQFKAAKQKAEAYVDSFSKGDRKAALITLLPTLSLMDPSPDIDDNVKNLIFSLPPNQAGVTLTPQGLAVVVLNGILPPEDKVREAKMASFKKDLLTAYKEDVLVAYINALRVRYPVTVNGEALAALLRPKK